MKRVSQTVESMNVKDFMDTFNIGFFGSVHDRVEDALRGYGVTVFKIERTRHTDLWRVQTYLKRAGNLGLPLRLSFATFVHALSLPVSWGKRIRFRSSGLATASPSHLFSAKVNSEASATGNCKTAGLFRAVTNISTASGSDVSSGV